MKQQCIHYLPTWLQIDDRRLTEGNTKLSRLMRPSRPLANELCLHDSKTSQINTTTNTNNYEPSDNTHKYTELLQKNDEFKSNK